MEIHIRPKIQKSPILNHPSLSLSKPIVVVHFPDLLKDIQKRGETISSKCGDNSSRKTVRNYRLEWELFLGEYTAYNIYTPTEI